MLKPLKQWICDKCGEIIDSPKKGWIEWKRDDDEKAYGFKIVHHFIHSPLRQQEKGGPSCYHYDQQAGVADMHLDAFTGEDGITRMLRFIDFGPYHIPEYDGPSAKDLREWTEVFRRLFLPHYEEARLYWHKAMEAGDFAGDNEIYIYSQENLKGIIEEYS